MDTKFFTSNYRVSQLKAGKSIKICLQIAEVFQRQIVDNFKIQFGNL